MSIRFYAASTHYSGLSHFATEAERDAWVAAGPDRWAVDRRRIDPDLRRELEGETP
jgi:hypothetical protein